MARFDQIQRVGEVYVIYCALKVVIVRQFLNRRQPLLCMKKSGHLDL